MSNEKQETILRKIRGLLKLANDAGATPAEAEAALGRVSHLKAQHGITDVQVEAAVNADTGEAELRFSKKDIIKKKAVHKAKVTRWDWGVLQACAIATDCQTYKFGSGILYVYGLPTDVAVCLELYEFGVSALRKSVRRWAKEQRECHWNHVQSNDVLGRSFKDGFVNGLRGAASRAKREQEKSEEAVEVNLSGSTALVPLTGVLTAKRTAVAAYKATLGLSKGRRSSVQRDRGAFGDGQAAGARTSLGRGGIR